MSFALATVKTKYTAYHLALAALVLSKATVTGLGARPVIPDLIDADADVNSTITSQNTYDAAKTTADAQVVTDTHTVRTAELDIIANSPASRWILLAFGSPAEEGDPGGNIYMGHDGRFVTHTTSVPTQAFPNL